MNTLRKRNIPSGAIADIAYLNFAIALFKLSDEDLEKKYSNVAGLKVDYRTQKRLDRNIKKIINKGLETLSSFDPTVMEKVRKKSNELFRSFLAFAPETIQLDSFGLWLLYERFVERDKPLIDELKWLQDKVNYDYIGEMIEKSNRYPMYQYVIKIANIL